MADSRPMVNISPQAEASSGVSAVPSARIKMPATNTGRGPQRSAAAPASGCTAPQVNCATAIAKLMVTMPSPVDVFSGPRNKPIDWRAPMVTIKMPAAASVMPRAPEWRSSLNMVVRAGRVVRGGLPPIIGVVIEDKKRKTQAFTSTIN